MIDVSVLLCVRNGLPHVADAVESVLEQAGPSFEIIAVDDGSVDGSSDWLEKLALKDGRLHVIHNHSSCGLTYSLNKALVMARGKYIARIDHDDKWLPGKLHRQVEILDSDDELVLVATAYEEEDLYGRWSRNPILPICATDREIRLALYKYNPFFHTSIMVRRSVLERINGYDEDYRYAQDYELWTRVLTLGRAMTLSEVLCIRRMGEDNISVRKERAQRFNALRSKIHWCYKNGFSWQVVLPAFRDLIVVVSPAWLKGAARQRMHGMRRS